MPTEESEYYGHYRILRKKDGRLHELGRGNMGITYKAEHTTTGGYVALKVISPYLLLDREEAVERFLREAMAAAKLDNPHIPKIHHLGSENGEYYYAMDFVDGRTIDEIVKSGGPIPWPRALDLTFQVADAFVETDEKGVIHRDIQPANIMVVSKGRAGDLVKLIDFGLVKSVHEGDSQLAARVYSFDPPGTFLYMSPEQCRNVVLDIRSDIYSLGATLWYMLAGNPPFGGNSVYDIQNGHIKTPLSLDSLPSGVPDPVRRLLGRMLAKDREDRPRDPVALIKEIEACQSDSLAENARGGTTAGSSVPSPYAFTLEELLRRRRRLEWNEVEGLIEPLSAVARDLSADGSAVLAAFVPRLLRVVLPTVPQSSLSEEILRSGLGYDHPLRWPEFRLESTLPPEKRQARFDGTNPPPSRRFRDAPHAVAAVVYELLAGAAPGPNPQPLSGLPPEADEFLRNNGLYRTNAEAKTGKSPVDNAAGKPSKSPTPPDRDEVPIRNARDAGGRHASRAGWMATLALLAMLAGGAGVAWKTGWFDRLVSRQEPPPSAAPTATTPPAGSDPVRPQSRAVDLADLAATPVPVPLKRTPPPATPSPAPTSPPFVAVIPGYNKAPVLLSDPPITPPITPPATIAVEPTRENKTTPEPVTVPNGSSGLTWTRKEIRVDADPMATVLEAKFHFANRFKRAVDVRQIEPNCGDTTAQLEKRHYELGESGDIVVQYVVGSRVGLQTRQITVTTNIGEQPTILTLTVQIPEILRITPVSLVWKHGEEPKAKQIHVEILGNQSLDDFSVQPSNPGVSVAVQTLTKGSKYQLNITPAQTAQMAFATLIIRCKHGNWEKTFRAYAFVKQHDAAPSPTPRSDDTLPEPVRLMTPTPPIIPPPHHAPDPVAISTPAPVPTPTPTPEETVSPVPSPAPMTAETQLQPAPTPEPSVAETPPPSPGPSPTPTPAPPDPAEKFLEAGRRAIAAADFPAAIAAYTKVLGLKPDSLEALDERGTAYDYLRQSDKAMADYHKAILLKAKDAREHFYRGDAFDSLRDDDKAKAEYRIALGLECVDARDFYQRGLAHFHLGEKKLAIDDFSTAIRLEPNHAFAYFRRGVVHASKSYAAKNHLDKGESDIAISEYNKAIRLRPDFARAIENRADEHRWQENFPSVLEDYNRLIELFPKSAVIYRRRGSNYVQMNNNLLAIIDLRKSIELDSSKDNAEAYASLGDAYREQKDFVQAFANYDEAISRNPTDAGFRNRRGVAHSREPRNDLALIDIQKACNLEPSSTFYMLNLADIYNRLNRNSNAIETCTRVLEMDRKNRRAYRIRADAHSALGHTKEAAEDSLKAAGTTNH